jgi:putative Holliday junction resolvase
VAVTEINAILGLLKPGQRLLGLDIGAKTIGLALSDVLAMLATPMETIRRTKFTADAERLAEIIETVGIGGLVLGLPVQMDGTEGPSCQQPAGEDGYPDRLLGRTAVDIRRPTRPH